MSRRLPHEVERMGSQLRSEVERQLLNDLRHYTSVPDGVSFDWSDAVQEGHMTTALGGTLEDLSGICVRDRTQAVVAEGWMDFIHGGENLPLFVFWLFLDVRDSVAAIRVKSTPTIPAHVWERLTEASRRACSKQAAYDSRWSNDPLVAEWDRRARS